MRLCHRPSNARYVNRHWLILLFFLLPPPTCTLPVPMHSRQNPRTVILVSQHSSFLPDGRLIPLSPPSRPGLLVSLAAARRSFPGHPRPPLAFGGRLLFVKRRSITRAKIPSRHSGSSYLCIAVLAHYTTLTASTSLTRKAVLAGIATRKRPMLVRHCWDGMGMGPRCSPLSHL